MALEVDGRPWRAVPDEVVYRCGLAPGILLTRPLLRELRRELRRLEAVRAAATALARRPLSEARLTERLRRRGVAPAAGRTTVAVLASAGLVDDARLARERAASLAPAWGNAAVAERLRAEGLPAEAVAGALAALPPERERAAALTRGRDPRSAWALLARRGFEADAAEDALGPLDADGAGGVG